MKLYGGRKINRSIDRRFRTHAESRDAIVWDVDQSTGTARCKVQGTNELVLCHYPQNWQTLPFYVKPGFAVRIIHKGGQKGFQEIAGQGRAIPSPVFGAVLPPSPNLFDVIISGIVPSAPGGGMYVALTPGMYRINGINYTFDTSVGGVVLGVGGYVMDPVTGMLMGAGTNGLLVLDPAPSIPLGRYDLIVVGTDGLAHVVTGIASASPEIPLIPGDHLLVCRILVHGGITEITADDINTEWELRRAHSISIAARPTDNKYSNGTVGMKTNMWGRASLTETDPPLWLRATIVDQNGWPFTLSTTMTIEKISVGPGGIARNLTDEVGNNLSFTGTFDHCDFVYRRDETTYQNTPGDYPIYIMSPIIDEPSSPEWPGIITVRFAITQIIGIYFSHIVELEYMDPDHPEWTQGN